MRVMRDSQRGVTLSGLVIASILVALVAMLGMKVGPEIVDYYKIKKDMAAVAADGTLTTVADVQNAFDRFANVDQISSVSGKDLDISREGSRFVIAVSYERRIKLFGPVSLVFDFETSTAK